MEIENNKSNKKRYWSSLEQFNNDPKFIEDNSKEFISTPLVEEDSGLGRRDFMKLMAATSAIATTACYQKPMHKILPYVNQPEEVTFGIPNYYASTCGECNAGCGTLVKTREGRPIKIEGNPDHPMNKGGLCSRGQAGLLGLYDPDRLRDPIKSEEHATKPYIKAPWSELDKEIAVKIKKAKSVVILTETINSPSTLKLIKEFGATKHVVYDAVNAEGILEAQEASYGKRILPKYNFEKAEVIASIDADFLGTWISPVEFTKQFAKGRKLSAKKKTLSKLYSFESMMTVTGSNADSRVGMKPSEAVNVALALAAELHAKGLSVDSATAEILKNHQQSSYAQQIKACAHDLLKAQGKSLVVGDAKNTDLQVVINLINSMLKNDGTTVDYSLTSNQLAGSSKAMVELVKEMATGKVDALIVYKANPDYSLPKSVGYEDAILKVGTVVYIGNILNETAETADYVLSDHHSLESWNDAEPQKGLFSLMQPTIRPLFNTRQFQDSLISIGKLMGKFSHVEDWHDYVQKNWKETVYKSAGIKASFSDFWESSLRDGVVKTSSAKTSPVRSAKANLKNYLPKKSDAAFEAVFYPTVSQYDGSHANNPWLQEVPDPVTRMTWDNFASVSPATADKLKLTNGDIVKVKFGEETLEIPSHIQPGLHDSTVAIALGYGREDSGKVGTGVGKNIFYFAKVENSKTVFSGFAVDIKKTGQKYILATPQQHQSLEGRPIVKEASFKEWLENPAAGNEEHEKLTTMWTPHKYEGYRWAMAIDLNSCTGCNACVVACQSENNIPVVGKDGVNRARIMHWIRIDRYYTGTPDHPEVVYQPMLCQHCENAPCETVCPVIATMHNDEGLNLQIYNRCVGTRYCANNCPYKVRRFNWFDYNYGGQNRYPLNMAQNPEVTIRSRGVMEKCSFCVQRIDDAKNNAKNLERPVKDGEVKTACQQSCPADAIVFGNINDPESEISQAVKDHRGYHVLEELNVRPSITYLTKIRNTENA